MKLNQPKLSYKNQEQPYKNSQNQSQKFGATDPLFLQKEDISLSGKRPTRFDLFVRKMTHLIMKDGKKIQATKLVWSMLLILKQKVKRESLFVQKKDEKKNQRSNSPALLVRLIFQALENITPSLEVRKVRVAGSTYLVPAALSKKKQENLALKWLIESAKKRQKNSNGNFSECLADEFLDASKKTGYARQKRDELHRLAQQNRAYIRYRWW
uniref:ribosomal protein S7 n=1 Tax=Chlorella ohadii TaxID=2649997 RepID=UPI0020284235|nr:ribosomal protein S7 [Chlorella ohadii]UPO68040.1 ribosomal protein S7 [Chlorella ohadii]